MARRSILSAVRDERLMHVAEEAVKSPEHPMAVRPSRVAKLHIGGYFDPNDATVIAFQKLKVDLRRSQQEMLFEAMVDFVAKHKIEKAFK